MLTAAPVQVHHGMQMPGNHRMCGVALWVVTGGERANKPGFLNHFYVQGLRRVTGTAVMIAAYQYTVKVGEILPPFIQRTQNRRCAGLRRMQEISQKQKQRGPVLKKQLADTSQVLSGSTRGHGLTQCPIGGRFTDMQVSDHQHPLRRPPDGPLRQQEKCFTGPVDDQRRTRRRRRTNCWRQGIHAY